MSSPFLLFLLSAVSWLFPWTYYACCSFLLILLARVVWKTAYKELFLLIQDALKYYPTDSYEQSWKKSQRRHYCVCFVSITNSEKNKILCKNWLLQLNSRSWAATLFQPSYKNPFHSVRLYGCKNSYWKSSPFTAFIPTFCFD